MSLISKFLEGWIVFAQAVVISVKRYQKNAGTNILCFEGGSGCAKLVDT
jgi:hypothetical protein